MTQGFYRRLAWTGIQKNRRLYLPYLLTCAGMVMMTYIVSFLSSSELLLGMPGGSDMRLRGLLAVLHASHMYPYPRTVTM